MSSKKCFYCMGTGAIEVNDDFERTCGNCAGTGAAAPDLLRESDMGKPITYRRDSENHHSRRQRYFFETEQGTRGVVWKSQPDRGWFALKDGCDPCRVPPDFGLTRHEAVDAATHSVEV